MTREEVAKKIRWSSVIWIVGLVNVGAMLPQLFQIVQTRNTEGLSLVMIVTYFFVQTGYSLEGYFKRNLAMSVTIGMSAVISAIV